MIAFPFTINIWRQKKVFDQLFEWTATLTHFSQCSLLNPPENIRKTSVLWCFHGDQKETLEKKELIRLMPMVNFCSY